MAIQYTRSLAGQNWAKMARELQGIVEEEMAEAGLESVQEGQRVIEQSGTGRSWTRPFPDLKQGGTIRSGSGAGRVNTGKMLNALSFRIVSGQGVGLDVGWIDELLDYFIYQDQGFNAGGYRADAFVAGVGVMAHLQVYVRASVDRAVDRAMRRLMNGL